MVIMIPLEAEKDSMRTLLLGVELSSGDGIGIGELDTRSSVEGAAMESLEILTLILTQNLCQAAMSVLVSF